MDRQIKFRAWDIKNKRMFESIFDNPVTPEWFIENPDKFAVMQFTGLKDKNGVEIYEGDIVRHRCVPDADCCLGIYEIVWSGSGFTIRTPGRDETECSFLLDGKWGRRLETIGNIYENPDLLEVEKGRVTP